MLSPASETAVTGIGSIKQVFALRGRGLVLVLNDHFDGTISRNGRVCSEHGVSNFTGPEFVDGKHEDGTRFAHLAVIATNPSSADWFLMGDKVWFQRGTDAGRMNIGKVS
jgi:hypothetical protein